MALIKCPECGKKISDKSKVCISCGFPIEDYINENSLDIVVDDTIKIKEDFDGQAEPNTENIETMEKPEDNQTELLSKDNKNQEASSGLSKKWTFAFFGGLFAFVILFVVIQTSNENKEQNVIAQQAISFYNDGNYVEALDEKRELYKDDKLGEYEQKIVLMGNLQKYISDGNKKMSAVFYFVGNYKEFENEQLVESTYPMVVTVAQDIANKNANLLYNFEYYINSKYEQYENFDNTEERETRKLLEPLLSEDKDYLLKIAKQIDDDIDYDLAKKEYAKYKEQSREEYKAEYNSSHPVQVTNNDCSITRRNGYYYCNGTVHNVSGSTHYYVKVKVTYMDKSKNVLTTDWTYAVSSEGIKGGENQQFTIMTKVVGTVEHYRVEILGWD